MDEDIERIFRLLFLSLSASHTLFLLFTHQSSVGDCGPCGSQHILWISVFYRPIMSIICYVFGKQENKEAGKEREKEWPLTATRKTGE